MCLYNNSLYFPNKKSTVTHSCLQLVRGANRQPRERANRNIPYEKATVTVNHNIEYQMHKIVCMTCWYVQLCNLHIPTKNQPSLTHSHLAIQYCVYCRVGLTFPLCFLIRATSLSLLSGQQLFHLSTTTSAQYMNLRR